MFRPFPATVFPRFLLGFLGAVFCLTVFGHNQTAQAQGMADAYLVKNVEVDVLDQSAVKARNKAFSMAQDKAFGILAGRFLPAGSTPKPPSAKILSGLVQDFEIVDEKLSKKRYRGTYNFRFRAGAVRGYFGHGPEYFVTDGAAAPSKILLLPYLQKDDVVVLWEKERNPFYAAMMMKNKDGGNILLPIGDISDVTDIGEGDPHILSTSSLKRLKARYEVDDVAVAIAKISIKQPTLLDVELYRSDRGRIELVKTARYEEHTPPRSQDENVFLKSAQDTLQTFVSDWHNLVPAQPEQPAAELANADNNNPDVAAPPANTEPDTVSEPAHTGGHGGSSAQVKVFFTGMPQWLSIRRDLTGVAGITNVGINAMKTNQVDMTLGYSSLSALTSGLSAKGYALEPAGAGTYILKRNSSY